MRNKHCMSWNMARNTEKKEKMRNAYCRTWHMVRNSNKLLICDINYIFQALQCRSWNMARNTEKREK